MKKLFLIIAAALLIQPTGILAQSYEKIADDTIKYVKAGTFGKPDVIKKTQKMAIGQVRVHYKTVTSRTAARGDNAADVTVYLDGDITTGDLQQLTDGFYNTLSRELTKLGIESVPFDAVKATDYYADRQRSQSEEKGADFDGKAGQAWVSINAFDGPVLYRWRPMGTPELVGYGQSKKLNKTTESIDASLMMIDVVVDFAAIMLSAQVKQDRAGWLYSDPYFHSDYVIAGMMSVPQSWIFLYDKGNKFDQYQSVMPVAERIGFADKPREDPSKAAIKSQQYFSGVHSSFTPLVIPAKRDLYLLATRKVLEQYAQLLAEKFRLIRSGEKPSAKSSNTAPQKPLDNTSLKQVNDEARAKNDTTAVTTGEITAAAKQAEKEGKFKLAADYYGELIKKDPANFEHYMSRGMIYMNSLLDYKAAAKDFGEVIRLNPNEPAGYYNRGSCYIQFSEWKKAKSDLDIAIAKAPGLVAAWLNRGVVLLNMKQNDAALADFNRGLELDPRMPNLYRARAVYYKVVGNSVMAQADELRAAQLERGR